MQNKDNFESKRDLIIDRMKKGYLLVEIASELEMPVAELMALRKDYEDVDKALTLGETHCMAWWCKQGRNGIQDNKFNFHLFNVFMKNNFGWGDKPSERALVMDKWRGDFMQKVCSMDEQVQNGKMAPEQYAHMMKALTYHAHLQDFVFIAPQMALVNLDKQLEAGEITKDEYEIQQLYIHELQRMRKASAEIIFEQEDIQYKEQFKPKRKCNDHNIGKEQPRAVKLKTTEMVEKESERAKEFFARKAEMQRLERERKQTMEYKIDQINNADAEMGAKALDVFKTDSDTSEG